MFPETSFILLADKSIQSVILSFILDAEGKTPKKS